MFWNEGTVRYTRISRAIPDAALCVFLNLVFLFYGRVLDRKRETTHRSVIYPLRSTCFREGKSIFYAPAAARVQSLEIWE